MSNHLFESGHLAKFVHPRCRFDPHSQAGRVAVVDEVESKWLELQFDSGFVKQLIGAIGFGLIAEHWRNRKRIHFTNNQWSQ